MNELLTIEQLEELSPNELNMLLLDECYLQSNGDPKYIKNIILLGADIETQHPNKALYRPLHFAVCSEKFEILKVLLELGANPNTVDKWGQTPLFHAAQYGHIKELELLLEYNADPNLGEYTPLHTAVKENRINVIELLLKAGVNLDARDKIGDTPLHWGAQYGQIEAITYMVKAGADLEAINKKGETPIDNLSHTTYQKMREIL